MKLSELVETSSDLSQTTKRLEKADRLSRLLARTPSAIIPIVVTYLSGLIPQGRIGVGWASIRAARTAPSAEHPHLDIPTVDGYLSDVSGLSGPGSKSAREETLAELFSQATQMEQDFLSRLLLGELRQGAQDGLMIEALARAFQTDSARIRRAVMMCGDMGRVAQALCRGGESRLKEFSLELFRPVEPMLAQGAESPTSALERLGRAAFDYKMDGARIQVHKSSDRISIFSRGMKDVSERVPDLVTAISRLPQSEIVLDGEALAFGKNGRPLPFQVTMSRFGRKSNLEELQNRLPLSAHFFDCLLLEGRNLIDRPAEERFEEMSRALPPESIVPRIITADPEEAEEFRTRAHSEGHEGVMAKSLDAKYEAGSRGSSWLKIKKTHTLDLVILAAEWGHGRRSGWLSNLHLGSLDPTTDSWIMLGKTFKGMTDQMLRWQTKRLQDIEVARDRWTVFVRPEIVVEVVFNELQESAQYPGGLALRFARIKAYRPEKQARDANTMEDVRALHRSMRI